MTDGAVNDIRQLINGALGRILLSEKTAIRKSTMLKMRSLSVCLVVTVATAPCFSQEVKPKISADSRAGQHACDSKSFLEFATKAEQYRKDRLLSAQKFAKLAKLPDTIVLDARDEEAHKLLRVKGSINLPYTSFSEHSLSKAIPSKQTRILIYCRNNIKTAPFENELDRLLNQNLKGPLPFGAPEIAKAPAAGLNIPTYITLFIYGYTDVWELDPIVDPNNTPIEFESVMAQTQPPTKQSSR
jgi:hypothetical protein